VPLSGPMSSWPLTMILVEPASKNNPHATTASMAIARTIAAFLDTAKTPYLEELSSQAEIGTLLHFASI
jgi:hypothetical protein